MVKKLNSYMCIHNTYIYVQYLCELLFYIRIHLTFPLSSLIVHIFLHELTPSFFRVVIIINNINVSLTVIDFATCLCLLLSRFDAVC